MRRCFLILIVVMMTAVQAETWSLRIYTEQYPPMNYLDEQGQPAGLVYEFVVEALNMMGQNVLVETIEFVPWARGYQEARTRPNTLLFSTIRNSERESDFTWLGPIALTQNFLIGSKQLLSELPQPLPMRELLDYRVGVVSQDYGELIVRQHPILQSVLTEIVSTPAQAAKMLDAGRIDLWSYGQPAAFHVMNTLGINPDDYTDVVIMSNSLEIYLAFHPQTESSILKSFQAAIDLLKQPDPVTGLSLLNRLEQKYNAIPLPSDAPKVEDPLPASDK